MSSVDSASRRVDAVVIGGGFYGCSIALYLARERGFREILIIERESSLLTRASYNNQARVHNGYHYPRDFATAYRSRINLPRFIKEWPEVICDDFTSVYAVAKRDSRVTAEQFKHFCKEIGAPVERAGKQIRELFNPALIEDAFITREFVFDASKLATKISEELESRRVAIALNSRVSEIARDSSEWIRIVFNQGQSLEAVSARYVFNCTYSGLNQFFGDFPGTSCQLVHEITELSLVKATPNLEKLGITVLDGPFFSLMPFPSRGLCSLSHVRYTPHRSWVDRAGIDPYERLERYEKSPRFERMLRDVTRFMPAASGLRYVDSLFELKTTLSRNSSNDGRPILFEKHPDIGRCYSVLGGKIDNVYDICEGLDTEVIDSVDSSTATGSKKQHPLP